MYIRIMVDIITIILNHNLLILFNHKNIIRSNCLRYTQYDSTK